MRVVPLNALCVVACPESDAAYSSYFFSTGSAIPAPCDTFMTAGYFVDLRLCLICFLRLTLRAAAALVLAAELRS